MIIYGGRASNIGNFDIPDTTCDHCDQQSTQRVSVFGRYAHIFWIPLFPIGKKAVAECVNCKRTIENKAFSPELQQRYKEQKSQAKRPFWHWLGLGLLGALMALVFIVGATAEEDLRSDSLDSDIDAMVSTPTMETDSISFKIKQVFDSFVSEEMDPSSFKYLTKLKDDKALILVQIPDIKDVEKEGRTQALEMIELITDGQEDLKDKDKYIGVYGKFAMMLIKTPTYEKNSRLALTSELYDFYGPKAVSK